MFLKPNLGYLSQIAPKNMQLLVLIRTKDNVKIFPCYRVDVAYTHCFVTHNTRFSFLLSTSIAFLKKTSTEPNIP